jgi:tRNA A-37 threonylcarbamoyl transferase component Bud32
MGWPSAAEYLEALQYPEFSFEDPELRGGITQVDKFGMPAVSSGHFASVFSLDCAGKRVAVKCFLQNRPDLRHRYKEVAHHLTSSKLPYTVQFEYIERGIQIDLAWYPVLKMVWIEGDTFLSYVDKHVNDKPKLLALSSQFKQMLKRLSYAGIAHGDLQHGNILVAGDSLKLVDYDGMYVPALNDLEANENGLGCYQHPKRTSRHFGPYLDNFSAWLIHASLVCLAIDPSLWDGQTLQREHFLFREEDLLNPPGSELLERLSTHSSAQLRTIPDTLDRLLRMSPEEIPPIDEIAITGVHIDQTLEEHFKKLGLQASASEKQIHEAVQVWQRVWAPEHYKHNKGLAKKASEKMASIKEALDAIRLAEKAAASV